MPNWVPVRSKCLDSCRFRTVPPIVRWGGGGGRGREGEEGVRGRNLGHNMGHNIGHNFTKAYWATIVCFCDDLMRIGCVLACVLLGVLNCVLGCFRGCVRS